MARGLELREFGNQGLAFGVLRVSGSDCRLIRLQGLWLRVFDFGHVGWKVDGCKDSMVRAVLLSKPLNPKLYTP